MRLLTLSVLVALAVLPRAAAAADCLGFFNNSEQGYKMERGRLEPSGPTVAAGTQLKFNGIGQMGNKFYLVRSQSDLVYDAQNVELTAGCDLPTKPLPNAR